MMKKILLVSDIMSGRGGTEFVVAKTLKLLEANFGVESFIFLHGKDRTTSMDWMGSINHQIHYTTLRNHKLQQLESAWQLSRQLHHCKPDCMIAITPVSIYIAHLARTLALSKIPLISWPHINITYKKQYYKLAQNHLAISTGIRQGLIESGIDPSTIELVFNPVSPTGVTIPRPDTCRFLYIGRLTFTGQKCIKDLLDACQQLQGDWHLDLVGDGDDMARCRQYAAELGIGEAISWHGWQKAPWDYVLGQIGDATSLVLCSDYEGFGLVLVEAMMHGVFCIASDCESGPADIINHGINGFLFKPHDIGALTAAMQRMINGMPPPPADVLKQSVAKFRDDLFTERFYHALCQFSDRPTPPQAPTGGS